MQGVRAVYVSVLPLRHQPLARGDEDTMAIEMRGLHNIVSACQSQGVRRLVYVGNVGTAPDTTNAFLRGRWEEEEYLLHSGLDITILRPGEIVGIGGLKFEQEARLAQQPVAVEPGNGQWKSNCNIAIDDLVYYLVGVLDEPRTFGQSYDVGDDEVLWPIRPADKIYNVKPL